MQSLLIGHWQHIVLTQVSYFSTYWRHISSQIDQIVVSNILGYCVLDVRIKKGACLLHPHLLAGTESFDHQVRQVFFRDPQLSGSERTTFLNDDRYLK